MSSETTSTGVTSCQQEKEAAGLQLQVAVDRIDDNGFVSLEVSPTLKAPSGFTNLTCGGTTLTDKTGRPVETSPPVKVGPPVDGAPSSKIHHGRTIVILPEVDRRHHLSKSPPT